MQVVAQVLMWPTMVVRVVVEIRSRLKVVFLVLVRQLNNQLEQQQLEPIRRQQQQLGPIRWQQQRLGQQQYALEQ